MEEKTWNYIIKRLTGTETAGSKLFLDQWLAEDPKHLQQYDEAKSLWELTALLKTEEPDVPFNQFHDHIGRMPGGPNPSNFWKYGIAAALTAVFILTGLYHYKLKPDHIEAEEMIVKKADAGKLIKIDLPDSSVVWLNSGSEISFAKHFKDKKVRAIKLTGEAYFDVTHDKSHPFVVTSGKLTTVVYGTSFSIRAYGNESHASVAVSSGKVGVMGADHRQKGLTVMLLPDDKLTYNNKDGLYIKSAITNSDADAWLRGDLIFEQTPLDEVFETLSRKYNVKIEAERKPYSACRLTARFNNQPLQVVLRTIGLSLNIRSKQIGQTIYLKGGNCM
jgi:transmembrane sensor